MPDTAFAVPAPFTPAQKSGTSSISDRPAWNSESGFRRSDWEAFCDGVEGFRQCTFRCPDCGFDSFPHLPIRPGDHAPDCSAVVGDFGGPQFLYAPVLSMRGGVTVASEERGFRHPAEATSREGVPHVLS